ncbi:MAG: VOC family protein [Rhodothermales bacterium]|nr:VOC family protein [Rhodothermales bacterium]
MEAAWAARREGNTPLAGELLKQAETLGRRDDSPLLSAVITRQAHLAEDEGRSRERLRLAEEAVREARRHGQPTAVAHALRHHAQALADENPDAARTPSEEALQLYDDHDPGSPDHANALRAGAIIQAACGQVRAAIRLWLRARALYGGFGVSAGVQEADHHLHALTVLRVDHLIFFAPNLKSGSSRVAELLGCKPRVGGRHPAFGTHNALLSLGDTCYFEVIAPDPDLAAPQRGRLTDRWHRPGIASWCVASDQLVEDAHGSVVPLGETQTGRRQRPDGSELVWSMTDIFADRMGGSVPFLIDWGDSRHPGADAPPAGELQALRLGHPNPDVLREALHRIDIAPPVEPSSEAFLEATIRLPDGTQVTLR